MICGKELDLCGRFRLLRVGKAVLGGFVFIFRKRTALILQLADLKILGLLRRGSHGAVVQGALVLHRIVQLSERIRHRFLLCRKGDFGGLDGVHGGRFVVLIIVVCRPHRVLLLPDGVAVFEGLSQILFVIHRCDLGRCDVRQAANLHRFAHTVAAQDGEAVFEALPLGKQGLAIGAQAFPLGLQCEQVELSGRAQADLSLNSGNAAVERREVAVELCNRVVQRLERDIGGLRTHDNLIGRVAELALGAVVGHFEIVLGIILIVLKIFIRTLYRFQRSFERGFLRAQRADQGVVLAVVVIGL